MLQMRGESQRKNGWESTFRLSLGARTCKLPYLEVGKYQRLKLCKFEIQIKFSGFPLRQTIVTNVSRFLAEIKIRLFKASVQFLCTADGFTCISIFRMEPSTTRARFEHELQPNTEDILFS